VLDYAANAVVYLPPTRLRFWFEARCDVEGREPDEVLAETLGPDSDPEGYWSSDHHPVHGSKDWGSGHRRCSHASAQPGWRASVGHDQELYVVKPATSSVRLHRRASYAVRRSRGVV
jgi:hypothetical protein